MWHMGQHNRVIVIQSWKIKRKEDPMILLFVLFFYYLQDLLYGTTKMVHIVKLYTMNISGKVI